MCLPTGLPEHRIYQPPCNASHLERKSATPLPRRVVGKSKCRGFADNAQYWAGRYTSAHKPASLEKWEGRKCVGLQCSRVCPFSSPAMDDKLLNQRRRTRNWFGINTCSSLLSDGERRVTYGETTKLQKCANYVISGDGKQRRVSDFYYRTAVSDKQKKKTAAKQNTKVPPSCPVQLLSTGFQSLEWK